MSLLEGHGDVTMDRAGLDRIPSAERFSRRAARSGARQRGVPARLLQQLVGLDAKLRQYEEGERFIAAVEEAGGPGLLDPGVAGPRAAARPGRDPRADALDRPDAPHPGPGRHPGLGRLVRPPAARPRGGGAASAPRPLRRSPRRARRSICAVSGGADSLALLVAGDGRRLRRHRRARRPRPARRVGRRGRRGRARPPHATGAAVQCRPRRRRARPQPGGPGPARRRFDAAARRGPAPATPPTTRPRPCCSTCCAAPASTAWPAWPSTGGGPAIRSSALRRAETDALCAEPRAWCRSPIPTNDDPVHPAQPDPPRAAAPARATSPGATWSPVLARTAACLAATPSSSTASRGAARRHRRQRPGCARPSAAARRAVRSWLVACGPPDGPPYPPSAAAVDRVLAVARGEAQACEVAGVGRVRRHAQRLSVEPPAPGPGPGSNRGPASRTGSAPPGPGVSRACLAPNGSHRLGRDRRAWRERSDCRPATSDPRSVAPIGRVSVQEAGEFLTRKAPKRSPGATGRRRRGLAATGLDRVAQPGRRPGRSTLPRCS